MELTQHQEDNLIINKEITKEADKIEEKRSKFNKFIKS